MIPSVQGDSDGITPHPRPITGTRWTQDATERREDPVGGSRSVSELFRYLFGCQGIDLPP